MIFNSLKDLLINFISIEDLILNYEENIEINFNLLEDQITFLVESIIYFIKIRPNKINNIIKLIFYLYNNLINSYLFKYLILLYGYQNLPFLIYKLYNLNFYLNDDIINIYNNSKYFTPKFLFRNDSNTVFDKKLFFELYFPNLFNIQNNKLIKNFDFNFLSNNNYNKLFEFIENGWFKDSIEYFIKFDEIDNFLHIFNEKNFNVNQIIEPFFFEFFLKENKYTIFSLTTIYGSLKIFKYLINLNPIFPEYFYPYCLQSGNLEIIRYFEINNYLNNDCLEICLDYQYNEIFEWLKDYFQPNNLILTKNLKYYFNINKEFNENFNK